MANNQFSEFPYLLMLRPQLSGVQLFGTEAREWGELKTLDASQAVPGYWSWMLSSFIHPQMHSDSKYLLSIYYHASIMTEVPNQAWVRNGEKNHESGRGGTEEGGVGCQG